MNTSVVVLMVMLFDPQIVATNISGQTVVVQAPRDFQTNEQCIAHADELNAKVKKFASRDVYITVPYVKNHKGTLMGSWCMRVVSNK